MFNLSSLGAVLATVSTLIASGLFAPATAAIAPNGVQILTADFNNGVPTNVSGGTLDATSAELASLGFTGNVYRNTTDGEAIIITFDNLQAHTAIGISFDLALIDSWDGNNGTQNAPDIFNITVDGTSIFSEFGENFGSNLGIFPPTSSNSNLFGNAGTADSTYGILINDIAHTASTLTIAIFASGAGFLGGFDENFLIDNLRVALQGPPPSSVPLPAAFWFMASGIGGLIVSGKKRRARSASKG